MTDTQSSSALLSFSWTENDIKQALMSAGVPTTSENVDTFIRSGGLEDFRDGLISRG